MRVLCPSCCGKSIPRLWVEGRSGLSVGKGADYSIVQTLVSVLVLNEHKIRRAKTSVRPRLGREQTTQSPALRDQTRQKRDRPSMSVSVGKQFAEKASRFFCLPWVMMGWENFLGEKSPLHCQSRGRREEFRPSMVTRNKCSPSRCPVFEAGQAHHGDFTLLILREKKLCNEE